MYLSAPVKRMIWQTIKIMNELTEVMGKTPDRVYVELPREEGEKVRTISRKKKISDLYAALKKEGKEWKEEVDARSEAEFRIKKLYLYYMQMGRCMYSGEPISLDDIMKDTYDIDHIIPQSVIKDDSFDNLVLVKRKANIDKSNEVVAPEIQKARKSF